MPTETPKTPQPTKPKKKIERKPESMAEKLNKEIYKETGEVNLYSKYCGYLTLEDIFTTDIIYLAAHKCACGFKGKRDTQKFLSSPWINVKELCDSVLNGTFRPKYYKQRVIMERGKPRIIVPPSFGSKVVQKTLDEYLLRPLFEPRMITTNYASVRGRGTDKMYEDIQAGLTKFGKSHGNHGKGGYIVTTDFSNYFGSINNNILEGVYRRYIKDERIIRLLRLFSPDEYGLSLGNETSQVPASYFPSPIDHYFKDREGLKFYWRYMDDTMCILDTYEAAEEYVKTFKELAGKLDLTLKDEKIHIIPFGEDFIFCKERFIFNKEKHYYYRLMNPSTARTEARKLRKFGEKINNGEMTHGEAMQQYKGVRGSIAGRPNTYKVLKRLDELSALLPSPIPEPAPEDAPKQEENTPA